MSSPLKEAAKKVLHFVVQPQGPNRTALELSGHPFLGGFKNCFFLMARPLTPPPPLLVVRTTKKKTFLRIVILSVMQYVI